MSRRTYQLLALALTLSGTSACDEAPAFGAGDVALRPGGYGGGGVLLNTSATGDWAIDHLDRNLGVELDGVTLASVEIVGNPKIEKTVALEEVWVEDGQIWGRWSDIKFSGKDFENSVWNLKIAGSQTAPERKMTLKSYTLDAEGRHRYTFLYPNDPTYGFHFWNFNYLFKKMTAEELKKLQDMEQQQQERADDPPQQDLAVCAPDPENGGSIEALVYGDVYVDMGDGSVKDRKDTISIACLSGGVGKAGLWGYLPYKVGLDYFEAGVRMVRADYCGDGGTFTKPGNAVVLRDSYPVYPDFGQYANNQSEAMMAVKGAVCLEEPRDSNFVHDDVDCGFGPLPYCKDTKLEDLAADGALIHSKIP